MSSDSCQKGWADGAIDFLKATTETQTKQVTNLFGDWATTTAKYEIPIEDALSLYTSAEIQQANDDAQATMLNIEAEYAKWKKDVLQDLKKPKYHGAHTLDAKVHLRCGRVR